MLRGLLTITDGPSGLKARLGAVLDQGEGAVGTGMLAVGDLRAISGQRFLGAADERPG